MGGNRILLAGVCNFFLPEEPTKEELTLVNKFNEGLEAAFMKRVLKIKKHCHVFFIHGCLTPRDPTNHTSLKRTVSLF